MNSYQQKSVFAKFGKCCKQRCEFGPRLNKIEIEKNGKKYEKNLTGKGSVEGPLS
jgi:hypothetical protein